MQALGKALRGPVRFAAVVIISLLAGGGIRLSAQDDARPAGQTSAGGAQSRGLEGAPSMPTATTDIVGTWQGTLHVAAAADHPVIDLRIVNKITKNDKGELKVLDYSIDQGGQPMLATTASFQDGVLKYGIEGIGGKYEGAMSADGKSITGTWSQGPGALPLILSRANADTAWAIPEPPKPMAADANPSFEVATIKPSQPDRPGRAFLWRGGRFTTFNTTLSALIGFAYDVQDKQVVGAQDWMNTDKFDIEAKPDTPGTPSREQMRTMLQKLLADRFQLKFHSDKKELAAYVLTAGKTGPKMKKDDTDPTDFPDCFSVSLALECAQCDHGRLRASAPVGGPRSSCGG